MMFLEYTMCIGIRLCIKFVCMYVWIHKLKTLSQLLEPSISDCPLTAVTDYKKFIIHNR
jgi:hypothetical protein